MPRPRATKLKAPTNSRNTSVPHDIPESSKLRSPSASARPTTKTTTDELPSASTRALKEVPSRSNLSAKRTAGEPRAAPKGVPNVEELLAEKFSSDSDGLVRTAKFRPYAYARSGDENNEPSEPPIMSGALGVGDVPKAHKEPDEHNAVWQRVRKSMASRKSPEVIQSKSLHRSSSQNQRIPRVGVERRATGVNANHKTSTIENLRKVDTPPSSSQGKTEAGTRLLQSGNDPPLDEFNDLDVLARGSEIRNSKTNAVERITNSFSAPDHGTTTAPASAVKGPNTPSFLSMANFKRRPRQGSLLKMVQQDAANVSAMDTSAVNEHDGPTRFTLGASSTSESSNLEEEPNDRSSSSRKRKAKEFERDGSAAEYLPRASLENNKQRKTTTNIHERPSPGNETAIDEQVRPPTRGKDAHFRDKEKTHEWNHKKDYDAKSRASRRHQSSRSRKTLPPPRSSSPIDAPSPASSSPPSPQSKQSTKAQATRKNDVQKSQKPKPRVTSAHLTAFLPKRRQRGLRERAGGNRDDEFAILDTNSSEVAEDEQQDLPPAEVDNDEDADELAHPSRMGKFTNSKKSKTVVPSKGTNRNTAAPKKLDKETSKASKTPKATGNSRTLRQTQPKPQSNDARPTTTLAPNGQSNQPKRTYGRLPQLETNKENHAHNDDLDQSRAFTPANDNDEAMNDATELQAGKKDKRNNRANVKNSKELSDAAKKFAEVDDWDLEFESASLGVDSSPWR